MAFMLRWAALLINASFFLGVSEDHDWLVECEACESEGCKECVVNVGASLMRKEKPKCGRAIML